MRMPSRILPATFFRRSLILFTVCWLIVVLGQFVVAQGERVPAPSPAKQREVAELVDETFGLSKLETASKKQQAIKKLQEAVEDASLAVEERYVVLTMLLRLSEETADFSTWREAMTQLGAKYDIDTAKETTQRLKVYLEGANTSAALRGKAMDDIGELILQVARANRYHDAKALLDAADGAVQRVKASSAIKQTLAKTNASITEREKAWRQFEVANKKLEAHPDDPAANQVAGRWQAAYESNWSQAITLLAKSSDAAWKKAAELEQQAAKDSAQRPAAADAWWDLSQDESGSVKTTLMLHAGELYGSSNLERATGIQKQLVAKRLDDIAALKSSNMDQLGAAKTALSTQGKVDKPQRQAGGWIDVLQWAEGADWGPYGIQWKDHLEGPISKDGITLRAKDGARYPLPAIIDGDYEMEVEFTRMAGQGSVSVFFPIGQHNLHLQCSALIPGTPPRTGVHWIDFFPGWGGTQETLRTPSPLTNNVRHRLRIQVARTGDEAEFHIDLDDKRDWIQWKGAYSRLTNVEAGQWRLTMIRHPWIGAQESQVRFHQFRVRMLSGTIRRDAITDADRAQDLKSGYVRLVGQPALATSVNYADFLVNQVPWQLWGGGCERVWPLVSREPTFCRDFYGAHAPSRVKSKIPATAKSFSVVAYNHTSRMVKYQILIDGNPVYDSHMTDIVVIKVDIPTNASTLELVVDPAGKSDNDHTFWCYPRYHSIAKEQITDAMLDRKGGQFKFIVAEHEVADPAHFKYNQSFGANASSDPLHYASAVPCDEFLFAHADSSVSYRVPAGMTRFSAIVYNVVSNHVQFEVWADERRLFESVTAGIVPIDIKLPSGTQTLKLVVSDMGNNRNDISMWCYPRLYKK